MSRSTLHYEAHQWADFARGVADAALAEPMEAHLDSGCDRCGREGALLSGLTKLAGGETEVPPALLERAKALYQPARAAEGGVRVLARLVYDSLRDPLPAGVRASDRPSQALYEAAEYSLDLHVSRERSRADYGSTRMIVVGQIAGKADPLQRVADVPVLLMAGAQVAARGRSNRLGEFQLEYEPGEPMQLHIPLGGQRIEVALPAEPMAG